MAEDPIARPLPATAGLLLAAFLAAAPAPGASQGAGQPAPAQAGAFPRASVRIVAPSASEVLHGPTLMRARVVPPAGTRVLRVDFFVDSVEITRDPFPPFEARWDAGKSLSFHVLRAAARFSDGTSAEDLITTRDLTLTHHEIVEGRAIERVELLVSVLDREGAPVTGLKAADFEVREAGAPVAVDDFKSVRESGDLPLSVAVLVDRSGSMRFQMKRWGEACVTLLASVRPIDQVRVAAFSDDMEVIQDFTHDAAALASSLAGIGPAGGYTRLFRATFETVRDMRDLPGRKALILLTDGLDTEFTSPSALTSTRMYPILEETVRMASRSGVTVILILPGPTGRGYLAVQDLAVQTGGYWMYPSDDLRALMRRLGERLLGSYVLAYDVERPADPDRKRPVKVTLKAPGSEGWEVRTALGTYARRSTLSSLRDDLAFGNPSQRARAAKELGRLGAEEVVPHLIKALKDDLPEVRAAAVDALAERREEDALGRVVKKVHDPDAGVREAALAALVMYGAAAAPRLEEEARRRGPTRLGALRALGEIGEARSLPVLADAASDRDCAVKAAALDALGSMAVVLGAGPFSREDRRGSPAAETTRILVAALEDPCREASEAAAVALGRTGDPRARDGLLGVASAGADPARVAQALLALPAYPEKEALAAAESRLAAPPPIREAARRAAALLYEGAALSGAPIPREAALQRLAALGGDEALMSLQHLLARDPPEGEGPEWHRRLEASVRKVMGE